MAKATADSGQKMIPADCVAVLLMSHPSVAKDTYEMMSAVDGTRTASSFEHQFRSIIARAKELKKRVDDGETFSAVTAHKRGWRQLCFEKWLANNLYQVPRLRQLLPPRARSARVMMPTTRPPRRLKLLLSLVERRQPRLPQLLHLLVMLSTRTTSQPTWTTSSSAKRSGKRSSRSELVSTKLRVLQPLPKSHYNRQFFLQPFAEGLQVTFKALCPCLIREVCGCFQDTLERLTWLLF
jgi:hypothetical protein